MKSYIIGIKGNGTASLAQFLKLKGWDVLGSDVSERFFTDQILISSDIKYFEGFDKKNVPLDADYIIYSTAFTEENNIEMKKAKELGLKMISYPEFLGILLNDSNGIAVAGTHGKTTTTAFAAVMLKECGIDINAVVPSIVKKYEQGFFGDSDMFLMEACEYQDKLKLYNPRIAIVTNVDYDHPDYFKTPEQYVKTFSVFLNKLTKDDLAIVCIDNENIRKIIKDLKCNVITYGYAEDADFRPANIEYKLGISKFDIINKKEVVENIELKMPGKYNILNAVAVFALGYFLKISNNQIKKGLEKFAGLKRRHEVLGKYKGALLIDDYAHNPQKVKAAIESAKDFYPNKKIKCVFQPHTFTRTKILLDEFSKSFNFADEVVILDIFSSAREEKGEVHSMDLVKKIKDNNIKCEYLATIKESVDKYKTELNENDVLLTIGAGDSYKVAEELLNL